MNYSIIVILFTSVLAIGVFADLFQKKIQQFTKYIIPLSIAFVLALICTHILPELFHEDDHSIGVYLLLGFVFQIILELLSKGIEHGHVHAPEKKNGITVIISLMIGLSLHSYNEGMPLIAIDNHSNHIHEHSHSITNSTNSVYFIMILAHKLPIAAILMIFFLTAINKRWVRYSLLILFAATAPLGAITGYFITQIDVHGIFNILLAISTGMLLHITTLLIFEDHHHQKDKWRNIALISGGILLGVMFYYF